MLGRDQQESRWSYSLSTTVSINKLDEFVNKKNLNIWWCNDLAIDTIYLFIDICLIEDVIIGQSYVYTLASVSLIPCPLTIRTLAVNHKVKDIGILIALMTTNIIKRRQQKLVQHKQ